MKTCEWISNIFYWKKKKESMPNWGNGILKRDGKSILEYKHPFSIFPRDFT